MRLLLPCGGTGTATHRQLQFLIALVLLLTGITAFIPGGLVRTHVSLPSSRRPLALPLSWEKNQQTWRRPATVTPENKPAGPSVSVKKSLLSASALVVLDVTFRRLLKSMSIAFPSSLAGCGVVFASMLTLPSGGRIYDALSPGSTLLARWLAVMFVPSLVTLPLADGLGSAAEFLKVALVIVGGFYFTLLTTSGSVLGIRRLFPPKTVLVTTSPSLEKITEDDDEPVNAAPSNTDPPLKPFSKELVIRLRVLKACSGSAAAVACRSSALAPVEAPLTTAFLLFATLHGFVFGARLPKKITKFIHPLVTCTSITWLSAKLLGLVNGYSFAAMLGKYKTGKLPPAGTGAGDLLLFLLGPAVVSLACQMYDRRKLMKENLIEVATAVGVSSFGGIFGTAALVRLLDIGSPSVRLSLLSRNITSPLAMAIAKILGADVSLAVSMVVVTGLIGANFGAYSLDAFRIKDAVARGLGIGAASHGLGTAAFANEEDAFPFAAIAMALTASACTALVSIPVIKKMVLQLALGW